MFDLFNFQESAGRGIAIVSIMSPHVRIVSCDSVTNLLLMCVSFPFVSDLSSFD